MGRHFSEILNSSDVEAVGRAFHERRTGERATRRLEVRLRCKSGDTRAVEMDVRHFAISASGLYRGGDYIGTHGVARDITERKYHETRYSVLQGVREAVWGMVGAEDIHQVLEAIQTGLETMEIAFEHCSVNVVDIGEPRVIHSYSSYGSAGITKRGEWMIADTQSYAGIISDIWSRGETTYRNDLEVSDPLSERDLVTELYGDVRSLIDVPFTFGTLAVNSKVANAFSERDIAFFEELAAALKEGFRRMEDLQDLAFSEQRYRTLVETPDFVVMLLDSEGRSPLCQSASRRVAGIFPSRVLPQCRHPSGAHSPR